MLRQRVRNLRALQRFEKAKVVLMTFVLFILVIFTLPLLIKK